MQACARTAGPGRHLVLIGFDPTNQFRQVLGRHCGLRHDHRVIVREQRHRLEVVQDVIWERVDRAVYDVRVPGADADRVAVGRRSGGSAHADGPSRPGHILNDNGMAKRQLHAFSHDAGERIGGTSGGERHNHRDRARRIGLASHASGSCEQACNGK